MSGVDRWLDAIERHVGRLLASPAEPDPGTSALHIEVVSLGAVGVVEWEAAALEAEHRNLALLRSKRARDAFAAVEGTLGAAAARSRPFGLVVTVSLDAWEPPADPPDPPPVRARPTPR